MKEKKIDLYDDIIRELKVCKYMGWTLEYLHSLDLDVYNSIILMYNREVSEMEKKRK